MASRNQAEYQRLKSESRSGRSETLFRKTTTTATSGGQLGVRSRLPCLKIPSGDTVVTFDPKIAQSGLFSKRTLFFRDLCRAIRVNPIGLVPNEHHSHLRGAIRVNPTGLEPNDDISKGQLGVGSH
ncbi:hypothetical protein CRG98_020163 [Punica granatum]|uniref:Uncharacterized protein n=1 Tax=Punica granatum TaxID=22663 RepID=A0A2I0JSX7_PUNGR|nr:hypothetical protein CRG98_020163 [Punica granatum]